MSRSRALGVRRRSQGLPIREGLLTVEAGRKLFAWIPLSDAGWRQGGSPTGIKSV